MLDIRLLRQEPERVREALARRGRPFPELDRFSEVDGKRREAIQEAERLKNRRNVVSEEIAVLKRQGRNVDALIAEMRDVSDRIKQLDEQLRALEAELADILLALPNLPHDSVPDGATDADNVEVRRWGEPPSFSFQPKPHWDIAAGLDLLDFEAAAKVTGTRFVFYKGLGARLERALINFMMDLHGSNGYTEMIPPYIVNRASLTGTGQLPKFEEDVFKLEGTDYFLIPTAEVPVTNYHRDEILDISELPKRYVGYSMNFRSEAGAAGRDTRGLIRQHQFNKVELVKLTTPETSYDELEQLTADAERVLQLLRLPYRVVVLCAGDLGFGAAKTYDLEVWMPGAGVYREISSCSNFEDFQARRANIRFRREPKAKPEFVHTLNGSGLAVGRTVAAILENYQQEDGSVVIPEVLRPYMGGLDRIAKA